MSLWCPPQLLLQVSVCWWHTAPGAWWEIPVGWLGLYFWSVQLTPALPLTLSFPPSLSLCHSSSSCCSAAQWHCRLNLTPVKPVKCQTSENFTFYNLTQSQFKNGTNLFCFISLQICGCRVSEHSQGWLVKLTATLLASWEQYLWKSPSTVLDTWIHFVTFRI